MRNPLKRLQKKINRRLAVNQYQVNATKQQQQLEDEEQNRPPQHIEFEDHQKTDNGCTDRTVSTSTLHDDDPVAVGTPAKLPHYMIQTHHQETTPPAQKHTTFLRRGQGRMAFGKTAAIPLSPSRNNRPPQSPKPVSTPTRTSRRSPKSQEPSPQTPICKERRDSTHDRDVSLSPSSCSNIPPPPAVVGFGTCNNFAMMDPPGKSPNPHRMPPTPLKPQNKLAQESQGQTSPQEQRQLLPLKPQQLLDPELEQQLKELQRRHSQREIRQQLQQPPPQKYNGSQRQAQQDNRLQQQEEQVQLPPQIQQRLDPKQRQQVKELNERQNPQPQLRQNDRKNPPERTNPGTNKQAKCPVDPKVERIAKAATALDNTGNKFFEKGEYDKAMASYLKALKLKNRTLINVKIDELQAEKEHNDNELPNPKSGQQEQVSETNATGAGGEDGGAEFDYLIPPPADDKRAKSGAADDIWISVATSVNNIAYLRQQSGKATAEETMAAYQNSLQIKRRILGKDNLSVGKTLNNLGTVHYLKREYEKALQAYGEALQIMQASLGMFNLDVGTVHSNIGDVYWAKSGEALHGNQQNPGGGGLFGNQIAALQHYRQALEIRWEQLKDHSDPKVIRLLEKIAALEMGESFLALMNRSSQNLENDTDRLMTVEEDEDEEMEAQQIDGVKPVITQLHALHEEVRQDVKKMDLVQRKVAIDMVKDKLRMVREMKNLSHLDLTKICSDDEDKASSPSPKPLSPVQRTEALSAVKERLSQLRKQRAQAGPANGSGMKDLKEIDSPSTGAPAGFLGFFRRGNDAPDPFAPTELQRSLSNSSSLSNMSASLRGNRNRASTKLDDGIDALRNFSVGVKKGENSSSREHECDDSPIRSVAVLRQLFQSKAQLAPAVSPSPMGIASMASF